jgi:hypothetical protein
MPLLSTRGAGSIRSFGFAGASAPLNLSVPSISGTTTVGNALSSSTGTWSGTPTITFAYQWKRAGSNISGATSSSYTLVSADAGTVITCTVTATNPVAAVASTSTGTSAINQSPVNTVAPSVSGTTSVGSVLTSTTGTWTGYPASFTYAYQWNRAGSAISGATSSTYTLVTADASNTITCTVTATNSTGSTAATSSATSTINQIATNTAAPSISGSTVIGSVLTSTTGTWIGYPTPTFAYQWNRAGSAISGATSSTYTTVSADGGAAMTCTVTGTNSSGSNSATSNTITMGAAPGQVAYTTAGTYSWVAPAGVTSVSALAVGSGADVGATITSSTDSTYSSFFINNSTVAGYPGRTDASNAAPGGSYVGDGGGSGGACGQYSAVGGGGSAGGGVGLLGQGTNGAGGIGSVYGGGNGTAGSGGGGGGGGGTTRNGTAAGGAAGYAGNGGNGGTGGTGGENFDQSAQPGQPGSGGSGYNYGGGQGGFVNGYGGGGLGYKNNISVSPGTSYNVRVYGNGAVRIIWPGTTRQFPTTNTGNV